MRKEFLPFCKPFIGEEEIKEVTDTLRSGWLTTGPRTKKFEEEFCKYIGCKYAIAVNSCTSALHLALIACNIKKGDEVITTPYTFVSTAEAILYTGANPIFVDIDENTFNISLEKIEEYIEFKAGRSGPLTRLKAILPVHIAGHPCDMDEIIQIAKKHNLAVIEDAAHAVSSEYKEQKIGKMGDATCFSFYATKNLTTGEGGIVTTDNKELADKIRILSLHGMSIDAWKRYTKTGSWYYEITEQGYKYNMADIQSALGLAQLKKIKVMQRKRENCVEMYNEVFSKIEELIIPQVKEFVKHAWHLYIIQIRPERLKITRNQFIEELGKENIGTSVHFIPLHLMPFYQKTFGFKRGDFPVAESVYEKVISLPLYPGLAKEDIDYVTGTVLKIVRTYRKIGS